MAVWDPVAKGVLSGMLQLIATRTQIRSELNHLSFLVTSTASGATMRPAGALERQFAMTWARPDKASNFPGAPSCTPRTRTFPRESIQRATAEATPVLMMALETLAPAPKVRSMGQLSDCMTCFTCTVRVATQRIPPRSVPSKSEPDMTAETTTEPTMKQIASMPRVLSSCLPCRGAWEFGTREATRKFLTVSGKVGKSSKASTTSTSPGCKRSAENERGSTCGPSPRRKPARG
mmetsp:Transcript_102538/g.319524  ORF Transcript_102538/g.319524 Transcript_102538/m.319524 type:complete len:234 (+) Transcript_102538:476-1177(+)